MEGYSGGATLESPELLVSVGVELWCRATPEGTGSVDWGGVFSTLDRQGVRSLGEAQRARPDGLFGLTLESGGRGRVRLIRSGVDGRSGEVSGTGAPPFGLVSA